MFSKKESFENRKWRERVVMQGKGMVEIEIKVEKKYWSCRYSIFEAEDKGST